MGKYLGFAPLALALALVLPGAAFADPTQDYNEGMNAATKGDMDTAIAAFTRIIEANPPIEAKNLAVTYNLRGMCHDTKSELQQALDDYNKAIAIDPKLAEAIGNRAFVYMKLGEMDKAKEDATAARRIDRKIKVPDFK